MCCEPTSPPVTLTREANPHAGTPLAPPVAIARPPDLRRDPIVLWHRLDGPVLGRLYALILAGIALGILAAAARVAPSRDHLGTHRQLGLPPCGFLATTGFPCPTSVFGSALAVATAVAGLIALNCAAVGRYPNLNWYRVDAVKLVYALALFLVLSWGFRIAVGLADGSLPAR
jgi:hypothetical protein